MERKILLLEPDKQLAAEFPLWLRGEGYDVTNVVEPEKVLAALRVASFDCLIIDIDLEPLAEISLKFVRRLKADRRYSGLPITVLTYRGAGRKIASALESGADNFVFKPFECDTFLQRIESIFKELDLRGQGKKLLDLSYIDYLIQVSGDSGKDDLLALFPVVFRLLIAEKIKGIIGDPVCVLIDRRARELISGRHPFIEDVPLNDGHFQDRMCGVAARIDTEEIGKALWDYIHTFLNLVGTLTSDILMNGDGEGDHPQRRKGKVQLR
jgi:CheY-like chemotaxis protein